MSVARRIECQEDGLYFNRYFFRQRLGAKMIVSGHHVVMQQAIDRTMLPHDHPLFIRRLIINIPPRYSKTEICTIAAMARGIAINPRARFIHLSTGDTLALKNSNDVRSIIKSQAFQSMWPMAVRNDVDSKKLWYTDQGGGMFASTVMGQVVGFGAGLMEPGFTGLLNIDDPIKPQDIYSETIRDGVNNTYEETISSRIASENVPIIIVMQRLHYNDLCGFLLRGGSGEMWHHLNLPVIIDSNKPYSRENTHGIEIVHGLFDGWLWPEKHNQSHIKKLKSHKRKWNAQYLQDPKRFDAEGALWTEKMVSEAREKKQPWKLKRTIVAVDPAVSNNKDSDDTGIGVASAYTDGDFSVDADYTIKASTDTWAQKAINAYNDHDADAIVVETNQGGDLVENVLRLKGFKGRVIKVHASKGKFARAEPVAALYELGRVKHNEEADLTELETEIMEYCPAESTKSPNRLDWLVWALTELAGIGLNGGKIGTF